MRSFHPSTYGDRFGFQEPTPIVPPGTEPDLHALNNLFVAAQREKERQLAASQVAHPNATGPPTDQVPDFSLGSRPSSTYLPSHTYRSQDVNHNIDPSLLGPKTSRNDEGECGDEGYRSDEGTSEHSATSDEEHELPGRRAPRGQIYFIVHDHSLTLIYRFCRRSTKYTTDQARISPSPR